ncbi:histidine kinase [Nocardia amamiensis]|uniref:histidine kinase n=1 Tax=Nocardia amamiensis TaxID=404578 RepID=A0ABS0CSH7_9NOCA|nr:histidine kinase [Nocardia amamiensis]MBF6298803.1 histidine kinase [Nocardia amamiensis]
MIAPHVLDASRRAGRAIVGALLGTVSAVTGIAVLAGRGPRLRRHVRRDRHRLVHWFDADAVRDLPDRDPAGYALLRAGYGIACGAALIAVLTVVLGYLGWTAGLTVLGRIPLGDSVVSLAVGAVGMYLCVRFAVTWGTWDTRVAVRRLGDDATQRRLRELERTRSGVVRAVDDERRRIERALHDGVQQRAVALALQLGRARRGARGDRADWAAELDHAAAEAGRLIDDLREVAWRIYPSVLDEHGLAVALRGLSAHTVVPLQLDIDLDHEPPPDVAAATYFVVAESVTNAAKHSGADHVSIAVRTTPGTITAIVHDNGRGGADPGGAGLTGLRWRVAALDGTLDVHSPTGGPTVLTAELPCAS